MQKTLISRTVLNNKTAKSTINHSGNHHHWGENPSSCCMRNNLSPVLIKGFSGSVCTRGKKSNRLWHTLPPHVSSAHTEVNNMPFALVGQGPTQWKRIFEPGDGLIHRGSKNSLATCCKVNTVFNSYISFISTFIKSKNKVNSTNTTNTMCVL